MCAQGDTVPVYVNGDFRDVDRCLVPIVEALNKAGITTIACCCGHGKRPGNIALVDGRELFIAQNYDEGRAVDRAFPPVSE